jgi:hypothetical protein
VLHTTPSIGYREGTAAIAPIIVGVNAHAGDLDSARKRLAVERRIDDVLADSFPASDPPSWTLGVARPEPFVGSVGHDVGIGEATAAGVGNFGRSADVIDVSRPMSAERTVFQGLASLIGAAGLAVLVPFAILLVGLPVAFAARGLLEAIGWLFGVSLR